MSTKLFWILFTTSVVAGVLVIPENPFSGWITLSLAGISLAIKLTSIYQDRKND